MIVDPSSYILSVCLVVITITIGVVGIYLVIVLAEVRKTLQHANESLDEVQDRVMTITEPIENMANLATYMQSGVKVFDYVSRWLATRQQDSTVSVSSTKTSK